MVEIRDVTVYVTYREAGSYKKRMKTLTHLPLDTDEDIKRIKVSFEPSTDCEKCAWGTPIPKEKRGHCVEDTECRNRNLAEQINDEQLPPKDALEIFDELGYLSIVNVKPIVCRFFKER